MTVNQFKKWKTHKVNNLKCVTTHENINKADNVSTNNAVCTIAANTSVYSGIMMWKLITVKMKTATILKTLKGSRRLQLYQGALVKNIKYLEENFWLKTMDK